MFSDFFKKFKSKPSTILRPDIMGLRVGSAFELDELKLKLIEPNLIIEGAALTQFIKAAGRVTLDDHSLIYRFYTDDDAYLQLHLSGGTSEEHIQQCKLWYFYDTKTIASDQEWERLLKQGVSLPSYEIEGHCFERLWQSTGSDVPPVAFTETTFDGSEDASVTDQFAMLYERQAAESLTELLFVAAEEKIVDGKADRCLVVSTGFDLMPSDLKIIG